MGGVMQLRRPARVILRVGISDCLSRRILWTARTVHETFEAISLVSSPFVSRVSIRIRCEASSCGAMIMADATLTLVGMEEEGGWECAPLDEAGRGLAGSALC